MFKKIFRKLQGGNAQSPTAIKSNQTKVFRFHYEQPTNLDQQQAQLQVIDSISNMNVIISYEKDNEKEQNKLKRLYYLLGQQDIKLIQLKNSFYNMLSFQYYPIRSMVWKVLLGYLPTKKNKWIALLQVNKKKYERMIAQNLCSTIRKRPKIGENSQHNLEKKSKEQDVQFKNQDLDHPNEQKLILGASKDHPLNRKKDSQWNTFFKDIELWAKIEKDVMRTRNTVIFFQQNNDYVLEYEQFSAPLHLSSKQRKTFYYDSITRILYLYAKLNPEMGYCQGMNQIAALIYYSFTNKNTQYQRRVSQSDAYFCFEIIMNKVGGTQVMSKQALNLRVGIFAQALRKIDLKLYNVLQTNKIDLKLFAFRWFMVYLLQQFDIDESLLIWDGLLCAPIQMKNYLYYMCLAVLYLKREQLLEDPTLLYRLRDWKLKPISLLDTALQLYKEFPQLIS